MNRRVVVTGLGVVSSLGFGWSKFWKHILEGRSGISEISYLDPTGFRTKWGGEVRDYNPETHFASQELRRIGRGTQFAILAAKLALKDAGLNVTLVTRERTAVCLGTTMGDIQALEEIDDLSVRNRENEITASLVAKYPSGMMSARLADYLGTSGPVTMIPTACAAGNYAIGYGYDLLRAGRSDIAITGGADPFSRIAFTGFSRLLALAPEKCQPFDKNRQGTLIGEGAGVLILETLDRALERGAEIYAEVLGIGYSCDGNHMTIPEVDGIVRVMRNALSDAQIEPEAVDYISAHGTGTPANDKAEATAIREVFGSRTEQIPVSSIKSMIGHTMGAASALEAVACTLAIQTNRIPPTINHETPDPECPIDCVPNRSRSHEVKIALNNSFAFGGNNACLVLGKYPSGTGRGAVRVEPKASER